MIKLNAEQTRQLIRALYFPTEEEILTRKKLSDEIAKDITIIEHGDRSFTAEIKSLDDSLLKEIIEKRRNDE